MVINITSVSGEHIYVESGVPVMISGQGVLVSGQGVIVASGVYLASGAYVIADIMESGMGVQIQSGVHVQISGQHMYQESGAYLASGLSVITQAEARFQNLTDTEYFELILLELKKIRTHCEILTDNVIKEEDISRE